MACSGALAWGQFLQWPKMDRKTGWTGRELSSRLFSHVLFRKESNMKNILIVYKDPYQESPIANKAILEKLTASLQEAQLDDLVILQDPVY